LRSTAAINASEEAKGQSSSDPDVGGFDGGDIESAGPDPDSDPDDDESWVDATEVIIDPQLGAG